MTATSRRSQQGIILIVAIIFLLLLSVATFFAVRVGLSDQRDSVADARGKVAHQVAEAGLDQAVEYVRLHSSTLLPDAGSSPDTTQWTACSKTDQTFPCGAIEPGKSSSDLRGYYYAYVGGQDDGKSASPSQVDTRSLKLDTSNLTSVGNFPVTYNVGAVMCLIDKNTIGAGKTATCTNVPADSDRVTVTLVSTGQVDGESARSTISEAIAEYKIINTPGNLPPVVSSSVISGLGNGTIVSNPSGGGANHSQLQLSVWTRSTLGAVGDTASGSFQTCEQDEYFRSGTTTVWPNGAKTCDDCACPSASVVSKKGVEGLDALDRDDTDAGKLKATDATLSPTYVFPCDLFGYVFGVTARENKVASDVYADDPPLCETKADTDGNGQYDVDEYLGDSNNFEKVDDCDTLVGNTDGGFFWAPNGCALSGGGSIGTPENPVVIVADCSFKDTGPTIYGLVFVRDTATAYGDGDCDTDADKVGAAAYAPGGGTATIYGAVVIEGPGKLNGGLDVISSPAILEGLIENPNNIKFARVPGTWTDQLTY